MGKQQQPLPCGHLRCQVRVGDGTFEPPGKVASFQVVLKCLRVEVRQGTTEVMHGGGRISRTVRDLVVGSGTGFEDRGSVELKGVPGTWQLLAVDRHGAPAGSAEVELASTPTPGPRTAMRRSDRAVAVMARRTPWFLRGMARLTPATSRN